MASRRIQSSLLDSAILTAAAGSAFGKLNPRTLARNPVIFVTAAVSLLVTGVFVRDLLAGGDAAFTGQVALWLWFTVLFANFAEAVAEGRGKAQADTLRALKTETPARRIGGGKEEEEIPASRLKKGDVVLVKAGEVIPGDGTIVEGVASVNESAITGESAPVIREAGGDRSAVTGGTLVLSDWLKIEITAETGHSFLDRMIALVEGAERQKTPNEIALSILLAGLTIVFLAVVLTLPFAAFYAGAAVSVAILAALLVTLIPTTIGGLLSAIGIAGMDRLVRFNVLATSGRAVEAAGDVDVLLLDKTGTITVGDRMATAFVPAPGVSENTLIAAALAASAGDDTPEGRSIVHLAQEKGAHRTPHAQGTRIVAFTAQTRLSGIDEPGRQIRKGAVDSVTKFLGIERLPAEMAATVERIARSGGTPIAVGETGSAGNRLLGIIHLKDVVKTGIRERFAQFRQMGVRTVMVTGDNPLTAAAIAAEAGVDDFIAEATPEDKLAYIRAEQAKGRLVAMCGDGTNDAPALAQSDVGLAMQTGTQPAREAANMVDLDSNPTKLLEVIQIGKQLLMTRGSLTTFSIANDVAKYFAIIPALFVAAYPQLGLLNVMDLGSPQSAVLSAVIFNALIIVALIPLALRGLHFRPRSAASSLRRNLLIYGLGGIAAPFIGIKAVDLAVRGLGLA